jgi:hypothetical protein
MWDGWNRLCSTCVSEPEGSIMNYSTCMCSAVEGGYEKEQAEWYR